MNHPAAAPNAAYPAVPAAIAELPLLAVQRLGRRTARDGMYVGLIIALLSHTFAVSSPEYTLWMTHVFVVKMNRELKAYFDRTEEVEVIEEDEPKPEDKPEEQVQVQAPEPEPAEPEPNDLAQLPPPEPAATDPQNDSPYPDEPYQPPAAAAAEAQDTLTTDSDTVNMTDGWSIVDNDGSTSRATGYSSTKGTDRRHVSDSRARPDGKPGGTGAGPAKPAPPPPRAPEKDMSRQARPVGGAWNCPFPAQADLNQVDRAVATISVTVAADGRPTSASVVSDPGYGFGAQAQRCAMSKRYTPALDKRGNKIAQTIPVRVRFTRQ